MAKLSFKKRANITEHLSVKVGDKPADPALNGATVEIRPDRRSVTERAWSRAQRKDSQQVNTLAFVNKRVEEAIVGWRIEVAHLAALGVDPDAYDVQGADDDETQLVEFTPETLRWLLDNSKRFDDLASDAVRRAYGEETTADDSGEGDRKNG